MKNLLRSIQSSHWKKDHRPAYGTDGDYFSKPSIDDIFEKAYSIMNEADPNRFPSLY